MGCFMNASNFYSFIEELKDFEYTMSSSDRIWDIIFFSQPKKWHRIRVSKYKETFYIFDIHDDLSTLEVELHKSVKQASSFSHSPFSRIEEDDIPAWNKLIIAARKWLKLTKKNWIKTNQQVNISYPLKYRKGIVTNSVVRASLSDLYRIDKALGARKMKKFIKLVETGYFFRKENSTLDSMTANDFFKYCKIAYIHGQEKNDHIDENLSGREMYKIYADGRDEGLLDIDPDSETEFADWIDGKHPKKSTGGHPWEIKRGGNTTHISLYVSRPLYGFKEGFEICLCGESIGRLKETLCMFLGIHEEGLPITISSPEGTRKRLLAQDNIGIVPCFHSLHRANQSFYEHEDVYDVLYYDDFGRYKRRITPFIAWEPLPVLKPF